MDIQNVSRAEVKPSIKWSTDGMTGKAGTHETFVIREETLKRGGKLYCLDFMLSRKPIAISGNDIKKVHEQAEEAWQTWLYNFYWTENV